MVKLIVAILDEIYLKKSIKVSYTLSSKKNIEVVARGTVAQLDKEGSESMTLFCCQLLR